MQLTCTLIAFRTSNVVVLFVLLFSQPMAYDVVNTAECRSTP